MRRRNGFAVSIWALSTLLACKTDDLTPPDLRQPIHALPPGAQSLVLLSDVENTWQRLQAHEVGSLLSQFSSTRELLQRPDILELNRFLKELEAESGISAQQDLVLNVLGGRAGVAFYDSAAAGDYVLVSELRDAARFRAALVRLGDSAGPLQLREDTLDGKPAVRLSGPMGELLLFESGGFVAVSPSDDLVRAVLALRQGESASSALEEPVFQAALAGFEPHNVLAVRRHGEAGADWVAQGFTWDARGLHFEHHVSADAPEAVEPPSMRESILGSMPDGLTLAVYAHTATLDWQDWLRDLDLNRFGIAPLEGRESGAVVPAQGGTGGLGFLPALPFSLEDIAPWVGDEMGIAVQGVEATTLAPVPYLALLFEVEDVAEAEVGLATLESAATMVRIGPGPHGFIDATYGGKTYRTWVNPLTGNICPSYVLDGNVVVIASTREVLHRIIDTRRTGKRSVLTDASFKRLRGFIDADARWIAYADQERLHRAATQLGGSSVWGESLKHGVAEIERASALLQHFPAGAAYIVRQPDRLILRAWMLEND